MMLEKTFERVSSASYRQLSHTGKRSSARKTLAVEKTFHEERLANASTGSPDLVRFLAKRPWIRELRRTSFSVPIFPGQNEG